MAPSTGGTAGLVLLSDIKQAAVGMLLSLLRDIFKLTDYLKYIYIYIIILPQETNVLSYTFHKKSNWSTLTRYFVRYPQHLAMTLRYQALFDVH